MSLYTTDYGYGMKSQFTRQFEVDEIVALDRHDKTRLGAITKIWKNGVVVVRVEHDWIVNDTGQLLLRIRGAQDHIRKFNPDGYGRGDDWGWKLSKFTGDDVTADKIRRNFGRAAWDELRAEAIEENVARDDAAIARGKKQADFEQAQLDNAENRAAMVEIETAVNTVLMMNLTNKFGDNKALFITVTKNDERHIARGAEWIASSVIVEERRMDAARFQGVQQWYNNDHETLMREIIHQYWHWS